MSGMSQVELLNNLEAVDIDPNGVFKYVLIEVSAQAEAEREVSRCLVRGYAWAEYHADIYDREEERVRALGLDAQCLGGGRIRHEATAKRIVVYGYSLGYGRANHARVVDLLRAHFPADYSFEWSDEGY
eukprot:snap_masked-scaffold592_size129239-processed-gene-0.15 protein:Tk10858 transcript:snap_masked-scaffold592_size129239-processed-gene-0.15-mRNA-1 annotation:"14 kda phosphohistidine phosphatase"